MSSDSQLEKLSRRLVKILRHQIVEYNLAVDEMGFVRLTDIRARCKVGRLTDEDVELIVRTNNKKRLELRRDGAEYWIRAVQGHSKDVGACLVDDAAMERITEQLPYCVHGTHHRFIESIRAEGLNRMSRKHIHLVSEIEELKQTSGFKAQSDTLVKIDMVRCMEAGMKFYRSSNGVILTEGFDGVIPPEYIVEIVSR
jgi:2'-phosphotransferase